MAFIWIITALIIILDISDKLRFTAKFSAGIILIFMPHIVMVNAVLTHLNLSALAPPFNVLTVYALLRLNFFGVKRHITPSKRLNFLYSGKRLLNLGIYTALIQIPFYIVYFTAGLVFYTSHILLIDGITAYLIIILMIFNGMMKVIFTSKWLNIFKRIFCFSFIAIPPINLGIMLYLRHIAAKEYDYCTYKLNDMPGEIENQICKTRYPILLVHGVGFRDARYFNYWGRIPKELRRRGATIYYGNQEGWATIEYNASLLKSRVEEILKETGAEKLNIIAHSKGGLDCRCMISTYNMGEYIASLTTMGTPHFGVKFADVLLKIIPNSIVTGVSNIINKLFSSYGDTNPDFKAAVNQLTEAYAVKFNKENPDAKSVYYQSYSSVMRCALSDYILSVPYIIGKLVGSKRNDGLVPEPSAHWGEFRKEFSNKRHIHGVSHGDIIDLKRDDYNGFDIISEYVKIVEDLKNKGY